jgi:hypothetical protein
MRPSPKATPLEQKRSPPEERENCTKPEAETGWRETIIT